MKSTKQYIPHPVLGCYPDNYNHSKFQAFPILEPQKNQLNFMVEFKLDEPKLLELLHNGSAKYVIHVECPRTRYRTVFETTRKDDFEFEVANDNVSDKLDLNFFILATRDFNGFRSDNFHSDYGEASFSIKEGSILAVAEPETFGLEDPDDSRKAISSYLKFEKNEAKKSPPMSFDPTDNNLRVRLSPSVYDLYSELKDDRSTEPVLCAAMALSAVADAIERSRKESNNDQYFKNFKWYQRLKQSADKFELDLSDNNKPPIEIAQEILANPVKRCLEAVSKFVRFEEPEE